MEKAIAQKSANQEQNGDASTRSGKPHGGQNSSVSGRHSAFESDAPAKVSMPLRGTGIQIASQLTEMHERRERLEMMNYQQKMVSQQQSIKMLMEEEKFITEANNAAKLSAEIAQF